MNDLIKWALLGVGAYLVYEYFYGTAATSTSTTPISTATLPSPTVTSTQPGVVQSATPTASQIVSPTSVAATSLQSSNVAGQMQQWANADTGHVIVNGVAYLTIDQWAYYYNLVTGTQLNSAQITTILGAVGGNPNDATRNNAVPLNNFLTAVGSAGLGRLALRGLGFAIRGVA